MKTEQRNAEALSRAQYGQSLSNYPAIYAGFEAKGIPADDIQPRVNVLTYDAWRAAGRQVKRGEHGVKVCTYIPIPEKRDAQTGELTRAAGKRPWTTTVFHISQTDPIN